MEDFEKSVWELLEALPQEIEKLCLGAIEVADAIAEALSEAIEQEIKEFEESWQYLLGPIDDIFEDFEGVSEVPFESNPFVSFVPPSATNHPACMGCQNYHGQVYSGNLLVCGMHPYGWDGDRCPDWEGNPQEELMQ